MGLYQLKNINSNLEDGITESIKAENIDYERYFESWLENNPSLLLDEEDDATTILWIGRQTSVSVGDRTKFPDLLGINSKGDLVIVELKKDKTPRDIIAQILEYASWGYALKYEELNELAKAYYFNNINHSGKELSDIFTEVFNFDNETRIAFNCKQKLYLVAEKVSPIVRQVSEYLRGVYKIDINHLEYQVMRTKQNEWFINVDKSFGYEIESPLKSYESTNQSNWNQGVKVKDLTCNAVKTYLEKTKKIYFTPINIINEISAKYKNVNATTVRCQLTADCVNHSSRKHYPSGQLDLYFRESDGKYRLYNKNNDGAWDYQGNKLG